MDGLVMSNRCGAHGYPVSHHAERGDVEIPSPEESTLRQRDCHPRIKCGVAMTLWMNLGAREHGRPLTGGSGRLCGRAVGERKRVGGAAGEAIDRMAGMWQVVGKPQEGPQFTDIVHRRERRRRPGPGVEELDDVPHPGWAIESVDGALDIRDQMTHTPMHARQGQPARPGLEGIEPSRGGGVNFAERPDMPVR